MNYKVLHNLFLDSLEQEVNEYILQGWRAKGGIVVTDKGFYQAISKV
ncbi:hypothetical protein VUJ46_10985 [Chryseobacterium sp. MYb264]|nr:MULTISPECIES: hypothetical protein [unclassified Chryseobacterium]WSO31727.1 hypothetical protein VUJ46_10985 [Chryseobacterium sp. MYb264]